MCHYQLKGTWCCETNLLGVLPLMKFSSMVEKNLYVENASTYLRLLKSQKAI